MIEPAPPALHAERMSEKTTVNDAHPSQIPYGIHASEFAHKQKGLLGVLDILRGTGVQPEIDLAEICIVGRRSIGKSGLLRAIIGVPILPPLDMSTRCPIEYHLSCYAESWSCSVYIKLFKDLDGNRYPKPRLVQCGDAMDSKEDIEERIRLAHRAALSPDQYVVQDRKSQDFKIREDVDAASEHSKIPETFSANSVLVRIHGPDAPNIAFYDLPGLLDDSSNSKEETKLLQRIVSSYLKNSNCLVLLALTCEAGIEKQGAYKLVKRYDPKGVRTIGVLTKPDRMEQDKEQEWLGIIRGGVQEPLPQGFFCVKQPRISELETELEVRESEEEFFTTSRPWSSQSTSVRNRLGTTHLTSRISEVLCSSITSCLPSLNRDIQRATKVAFSKLHSLPSEAPKDPTATVLHAVLNFHRDVSKYIEGVPDSPGITRQLQTARDNFYQTVKTSAPEFRPYERKDDRRNFVLAEITPSAGGSETSDEEYVPPEEEPETSVAGTEMTSDEEEEYVVRVEGDDSNYHWILYEEDITRMCNEVMVRELPNNIPFVVKRKLVEQFVKQWEVPIDELVGEMETVLRGYIHKFVRKHFEQYSSGGLYNAIREVVIERLEQSKKRFANQARFLLNIEARRTFTINTQDLAEYKQKFSRHYTSVFLLHKRTNFTEKLTQGINGKDSPAEHLKAVQSALQELGLSLDQPLHLSKLIESESERDMIAIMTDVRAYFEVAYKRFVDVILMCIDDIMVSGLVEGLDRDLLGKLGVTGDDAKGICTGFLANSPEIVSERVIVKDIIQRLERAKQELAKIWP
ncbi:dynamin central region protein [Ceratobasidium sp. AG-Ba]|nr:dynamin central region protein [Ceratobasidium sp. AG-Ba]